MAIWLYTLQGLLTSIDLNWSDYAMKFKNDLLVHNTWVEI